MRALTLILVAALGGSAAAQPVVRDHRGGAPVVDATPRQAPPPPRVERSGTRRGHVWVAGHWDWRAGRWQWVPGRYERVRKGKRWRSVNWENRNGAWVRVGGDWEDAPLYPTQAPPPPREERQAQRRGFIWVTGRWDWRDGDWQWTPGHWERARVGFRWNEGRWDRRGDRWEWVEGSWVQDAPPPPPTERPRYEFDSRGWTLLGERGVSRRGNEDRDRIQVGRYEGRFSKLAIVVLDSDLELIDFAVKFKRGPEWRPSVKHYFRENSRSRTVDMPGDRDRVIKWIDIRYRNLPDGGRARVQVWGRSDGDGGQVVTPMPVTPTPPPVTIQPVPPPVTAQPVPTGPTTAPPPPRPESVAPRAGFIWVRGHYEWRNRAYEWIPGHWERQRAKARWVDARWELQGRVWVFVPGGWQ